MSSPLSLIYIYIYIYNMHLCTQAKRRDAEQFRLSGTKDAAHEIGLGVRERARAGTLQAIEDMVMEVPRKE